jgi:hypothetical protein
VARARTRDHLAWIPTWRDSTSQSDYKTHVIWKGGGALLNHSNNEAWRFFLDQKGMVAPSSGRAFTKSNICSNGGAIHSVGNGWFTKFWDDVWLVNAPLRIQFTKLYETCVDKQAMVAEYAARDWHIQFQRMLSLEAQAEWEGLQGMLQCVSLAQEDDRISWGLTTSKRFSTSSLYKFLTSWGVNNSTAKRIWKCRVHLKIRVFLWQVFQNRILIAQQFCARN